MEPSVALQIWGDADGMKDNDSEHFSHRSEAAMRDSEGMKANVDGDGQCSRAASSSFSVDAHGVLSESCKAGSMERPPQFGTLSHSLRYQAAEPEVQEGMEQSRFMSKTIGMHPTGRNRWPVSGKLLSEKDWDYHRPLHRQHSLPEEVLLLTTQGSTNFLYPRDSAKIYRRAVTFPLEREHRADTSASGASLASLATAASFLAAPSTFSSFSGQDTGVTTLFKPGELEGFSPARKIQDGSKRFGELNTNEYEKFARSVDELPFRSRFSSSLSADVGTRPFGLKSRNSFDDKHDTAHIRDMSPGIQRSYDTCAIACSETIAPSECDASGLSGQCSPQRKLPSEVQPAETCGLRKCTATVSLLPKSSCSSHLPPLPHSEATRSLSRSRFERLSPLEAHMDRMSPEAAGSCWCVDLQRMGNAESRVARTDASAPSCSGITADGDTGAEKSFEEESTIRVVPSGPCGKGKAGVEQASAAEAVRSDAPPESKEHCCPKAPLLTCALPPCSEIPEFELDGGLLLSSAGGPGSHADSEQTEVVGSHAVDPPPQHATDERMKLKMLQDFQLTASRSDVRTSFSGQLQQALSVVANPDGDTMLLAEARKHNPVDS